MASVVASSPASLASPPKLPGRLLGHTEPRIYTKPLRELTPETSLGFAAIRFATDVLLLTLFPWQEWLLIHALELLPNGRFRFRTVLVLVARQNGKSTVSIVLALFFLFVLKVATVLGTAQDLDSAEAVWEQAVTFVEEMDDDTDLPVRPDLKAEHHHTVRTNGKMALVLTRANRHQRRYRVKAANRRAGRGFSGDLTLLDELREHQTWDAWSAITKTMMGRPNGQTWAMSNAGDITSAPLRFLRKKAHERLGDPDGICAKDPASNEMPSREDFARIVKELELEDFAEWEDELKELEESADDLGIFEWSAAPECEVVDPRAWAQANPSMGYMISPQSILSAALTDKEWEFRTEVLCQWADDALTGPFPVNAFAQCAAIRDVRGRLLPSELLTPAAKRMTACVTVSEDRAWTYVAICGTRTDGLPQVEVAATLEGSAGLVRWFTDPAKPHRKRWQIAVQTGGGAPEASLIAALKRAGLRVVPWKPADVVTSWSLLYDAVKDHRIRHTSDKQLTDPASKSKLKPTESGAKILDRRRARGTDPVPLVGAQGAYWLWQLRSAPSTTPAIPVVAASTSTHELDRIGF